MTTGRFSLSPRRFTAAAQGCVLLGALAGTLLLATAARAADAEATGSIAPTANGAEWWRLRPAQGPMVEVPRSEGAALPEARKAVRMVYPTPYPPR